MVPHHSAEMALQKLKVITLNINYIMRFVYFFQNLVLLCVQLYLPLNSKVKFLLQLIQFLFICSALLTCRRSYLYAVQCLFL